MRKDFNDPLLKSGKNKITKKTYLGKFMHCYHYREDVIFVIELLENSTTHPSLTKGCTQIIQLNYADALQGGIDYFLWEKSKAYNDPLNHNEVGSNYHNLVDQNYIFTLQKYGVEWELESLKPIETGSSSNGLLAYSGHIIDVVFNNLSVEVLVKVDKDTHVFANHKKNQRKTYFDHDMKSYISYYFDLSVYNENAIRFDKTFGPYVSYDEQYLKHFSQEKLIFIEHTPPIVKFDSLTSLDRNSLTLFRVVPYKEETDINE